MRGFRGYDVIGRGSCGQYENSVGVMSSGAAREINTGRRQFPFVLLHVYSMLDFFRQSIRQHSVLADKASFREILLLHTLTQGRVICPLCCPEFFMYFYSPGFGEVFKATLSLWVGSEVCGWRLWQEVGWISLSEDCLVYFQLLLGEIYLWS